MKTATAINPGTNPKNNPDNTATPRARPTPRCLENHALEGKSLIGLDFVYALTAAV
jgi:hypothetical protein